MLKRVNVMDDISSLIENDINDNTVPSKGIKKLKLIYLE